MKDKVNVLERELMFFIKGLLSTQKFEDSSDIISQRLSMIKSDIYDKAHMIPDDEYDDGGSTDLGSGSQKYNNNKNNKPHLGFNEFQSKMAKLDESNYEYINL